MLLLGDSGYVLKCEHCRLVKNLVPYADVVCVGFDKFRPGGGLYLMENKGLSFSSSVMIIISHLVVLGEDTRGLRIFIFELLSKHRLCSMKNDKSSSSTG